MPNVMRMVTIQRKVDDRNTGEKLHRRKPVLIWFRS